MDRRRLLVSGAAAAAAAALPVTAAFAITSTEPAVRYVIIPDIMRNRQTVIEDVSQNWRTVIYEVMERWTIEEGNFKSIEVAPVDSDRYAQWLLETPPKNGIPPHISFGGCIVPSKQGDPTFKSRWDDATRRGYGVNV